MGEMGNIVAWVVLDSGIQFVKSIESYEILCFNRKGDKQKKKFGIGEQQAKCHQNPENSARSSYHGGVGVQIIDVSDQLLALGDVLCTGGGCFEGIDKVEIVLVERFGVGGEEIDEGLRSRMLEKYFHIIPQTGDFNKINAGKQQACTYPGKQVKK